MVKVKTVCRNPDNYTRETRNDIYKISKNIDSTLHPFQKAREYQRALNAAKIEKIFAKPFVKALDNHTDSISALARSEEHLTLTASGSANGEFKMWDLTNFSCTMSIDDAHQGSVTGICFSQNSVFTCGRDSIIKQWTFEGAFQQYLSANPLTSIDCNRQDPQIFSTSGSDGVAIWNTLRSDPLNIFQWSPDTYTSLKFNPSETNLLCCTNIDRSVLLFDLRASTPLHKITLKMKSNAVAWNPRAPMYFTLANEDSNLYTFDTRYMSEAAKIHKDHLNAVTSVAYSPTGREFVSGSFDKSVRIFYSKDGRSREVYHGRRMQWVNCVEFTGDSKFVISGSDDANVRIWKAQAHMPLKTILPREREALQYREKLKRAYGSMKEIRRIIRHRHLPKLLFNMKRKKQEKKSSRVRKDQNVRAHTKPHRIRDVPERKRVVVQDGE